MKARKFIKWWNAQNPSNKIDCAFSECATESMIMTVARNEGVDVSEVEAAIMEGRAIQHAPDTTEET